VQRNEKNRDPKPAFMSLDNFQLPPFLTAELYRDSLVDLDDDQIKKKTLQAPDFISLGNNKKQVLIIVNDADCLHVNEDDLAFLVTILTACKLSLSDTALINFNSNPGMTYKSLQQHFKPVTIICLGVELNRLAFPLEFPLYQVQKYNGQAYLSAPSLRILSGNQGEKLQFWNALKKLFSI